MRVRWLGLQRRNLDARRKLSDAKPQEFGAPYRKARGAPIAALVSPGWNYRSLAGNETAAAALRKDVKTLEDKQERGTVMEAKLDAAVRTLDKIGVQLKDRPRRGR